MFDDRKATGNPGRITCCGAQGESQQQFPDEAPVFAAIYVLAAVALLPGLILTTGGIVTLT